MGVSARAPADGQHQREALAHLLGVPGDALPVRLPRAEDYGYILLAPDCSAAGPYKRWPTDRWHQLANALRAQGYAVEWALADEGDLRHLIKYVAHASLVIGLDSGPVHLADLLSVPVIGLYAATSTASFGPYCDRSLCVDKHREAWAACMTGSYHSAEHIRDGRAMALIGVDDVLAQVARWGKTARAA